MAQDQSALLEVLDALNAPISATDTGPEDGHRGRGSGVADPEATCPAGWNGAGQVDQALFAVVVGAYLHGVSTRKVDDLVKALGADTGLGKARVSHHVVSPGRGHRYRRPRSRTREVLESPWATAKTERSGPRSLRSLKVRGLGSFDAHTGRNQAISAVLLGSSGQPRRVGFLPNVPTQVPQGSSAMVAAAIRTISAQPEADMVRDQLRGIVGALGRQSQRSIRVSECHNPSTVRCRIRGATQRYRDTQPRTSRHSARRIATLGLLPAA